MWKHSYHPYNLGNKITEQTKLLIGIGDSFCAGRGACSIEIWEKYGWDMERMYGEGKGEVEILDYANSWVNQLCKNHMTDWSPLNLGMSGKGNRFAIKELTANKILGIERAKEKIVVFAVSGFERLDLAKDLVKEDHFTTQWPVYSEEENRFGYSELTYENGKSIHSEKFVINEFILNMIELIDWCKLHNAKLLLISAFTPELNKNHFIDVLSPSVINPICQVKLDELISVIPWERIIRPLGFSCITDMLMSLEGWEDQMKDYGFRNVDIETIGPNGFMTKCQHPSEKAHKLLAEIIYEHILNYDNLIPSTKKSTKTKMI